MTPAENLDLLCNTILDADEFNMGSFSVWDWDDSCHTPVCIAGYAVWLWPDIAENSLRSIFVPNYGLFAEKVGLNKDDLADLCSVSGNIFDGDPEDITPRMAVAAIRRLRDTGVVCFNWDDALTVS